MKTETSLATKLGRALGLLFALVLFTPLVSGGFGALSGLLFGWAFDDTYALVTERVGLGGIAAWQAGAFMGWFGGFLRGVVFKDTSTD